MSIDQHGDHVLQGMSLRKLPKVSLHAHLDGGVRPATILELADQIGLDVPEDTADDLADRIAERYGDASGYVSAIRKAAEALVAERLMLGEDVERCAEWAADWDRERHHITLE